MNASARTSNTTGVDQNLSNAETVLLYPNPTSGAININASEAGSFSIYSFDGKALETYPIAIGVTSIQLPKELASGIYVGRYAGDDGSTAIFKIVKE